MGSNGLTINKKNGGETQNPNTETIDIGGQTYNDGLNNTFRETSGSTGMNSMFDDEITPVAGKLIEVANKLITSLGLTGKASNVSIANSNTFKGVGVLLTLNKNTYLQPLIFDERKVKTIQETITEAKANNRLVFAPAILNSQSAKYLAGFEALVSDDTTVLEPIVLISSKYKTDDSVVSLAKDIFKRIEAKPFANVKDNIAKDKSKQIQSHFSSVGQNVRLELAHVDTQATLEDVLLGGNKTLLSVDAKVETILGKKSIPNQNGGQDQIYALRPVVFIREYNKPASFAKYNLEYGLLSVVAATVLSRKDRIVTALIPNKEKGLNIGALNPIFSFHKEQDGKAKVLNFLKGGNDIQTMSQYILRATTDASIGIDIEYRSNGTALNILGSMIDTDVSAKAKNELTEQLQQALANITGSTYQGKLIERSFTYPTGEIIFNNGTTMPISNVDAIWLASKDKEDLAFRWLQSDHQQNSIVTKMEILNELATSDIDIEIRLESIGYKIILDVDFVNKLVEAVRQSGFNIEAAPILDLNIEQSGFTGIDLSVTQGVSSVGFTPASKNGAGFIVVG